MIRKAVEQDIEAIDQTYTELLTFEQETVSHSNWRLGVYPTRKVPEAAVSQGTMYVLEEDGVLCASMVLNQYQAPEYASVPWKYDASEREVFVIHTLCIPPSKAGRGYGRQMVAYAKEFAKEKGGTVIRLDTYAGNEPAKSLYQRNGFRIAGYADVKHEGVIDEKLVYLEHELGGA